MSIAFLLRDKNDAVIWRGPKKHAMIKQFIQDVYWQELDYLVIDTPPGTSDEHMSTMESIKDMSKGAVLVTTPNLVAVADVRREVTFCQKTGLNIIGIVENMSGFVCPNCQDCSQIFPTGGGQLLSDETGIKLLGKIPIDPNLVKACESGENFIENFKESVAAVNVNQIRDSILQIIGGPTPMET
jgi:Mrp family chromosome partitioning ATPase